MTQNTRLHRTASKAQIRESKSRMDRWHELCGIPYPNHHDIVVRNYSIIKPVWVSFFPSGMIRNHCDMRRQESSCLLQVFTVFVRQIPVGFMCPSQGSGWTWSRCQIWSPVPLSPSPLSQETFIQVTCRMEELLNRPTIVSIIAMKILYHTRAVSV